MIDRDQVHEENNKAERQCQDNLDAFYHYKLQKLFPKLHREKNAEDMVEQRSRDIVAAFKQLQRSVAMRTPMGETAELAKRMNYKEPPLCYPAVAQQIKEKRRQRKLLQDLNLKDYLEDSDSDFDEHSSVASDRVGQYASLYKFKTRRSITKKKIVE